MRERCMMKKSIIIVITLFMISLIFQSGVFVEAKGKVRLSRTSASVYVGKSIILKVKNTKSKAKWSSKNKKIAVVNSKGKVTGKKKGTTKIIAKVGKKKYKCKVVVKSIAKSSANNTEKNPDNNTEKNPTNNTEKNHITYAEPYQKSDVGDIYDGNDYFTMMGKKYYHGFCGEPCYNSWAQYNLAGKYSKMSFSIGHVDNTAQEDATFIIELDGVNVEQISLTGDMTTITKTISVKGAKNMKIHIRDAEHVTSLYGVANIVFDNSISLLKDDSSTTNITKGNVTYGIPYQTGDVGYIYKGNDYFTMMGIKYYYGFRGEPCYNSFAQINLEKKYKTVSYKIGHIDDTAYENAKLQLFLDGNIIDEIQLSGDMNTLSRTVNVTNGTNLKMVIRDAEHVTSWYGIADIICK